MLKLGGEIIMDGISVARPDNPRFASSFSLEGDDPEKIKQWCQLIGDLLKVSKDKIEIDLTNVEDGADQPATAPESKPEGKEKLKPESKVRSQ